MNTPARTNVRKRVATPDDWKANKAKAARASGESYVSPHNGKTVPAR